MAHLSKHGKRGFYVRVTSSNGLLTLTGIITSELFELVQRYGKTLDESIIHNRDYELS